MKKVLFIISLLINVVLLVILLFCNRNFTTEKNTYSIDYKIDESVKESGKVVFIGNSITENWKHLEPEFFRSNNFVCNGVGGNTSSQILLRFRKDVLQLNPQIVVINAGINDIAEADGFYNEDFTFDNIKSMVDIALQNEVEVIVSSVLPVRELKNGFRKIDSPTNKIISLNDRIKQYALDNKIVYVDYFELLRDEHDLFNSAYTFDGIHPNEKGYEIMEKIIIDRIEDMMDKNQL